MVDVDIDKAMSELDVHKNQDEVNLWIKQYEPFIIVTLSKLKNEYIQIENDESYSIGLMAFVEAIERYDLKKGPFLPYAQLVITSRVKTHLKQEKRHQHENLETIDYEAIPATLEIEESDASNLSEEILELERALKIFKINFKDLVKYAPKHIDTKQKTIEIAQKTCENSEFMQFIEMKHRLPISKMSERFKISVKTIMTYKLFIITVILILDKNLKEIKEWIKIT